MMPERTPYAWYVVTLLAVASMFSFLDRTILNLLVEPIKAALVLDDVHISLLQGPAFALFFAFSALPIAALADRYNRVRLIGLGIVLWSAMTVCCGLADSFWQLFLARMGVGVGEAALLPAASSLLVDYFPRRLLARANSVFVLGSAVGGSIAMLGGGQLIAAFAEAEIAVPWLGRLADWQLAFVAVGLPGVGLAAILLVTVREPTRRQARPNVRAERAELLRFADENRATLATLLLSFPLAGAVFNGWVAWFPSYVIRVLGQSPAYAAAWMGALMATVGIGGIVAGGMLADRHLGSGRPAGLLQIAIGSIAGMAIAGTLGPLTGTTTGALAGLALCVFLGSVLAILPALTLQLITPAHLRAQVIAYYLLVGAILSYGLGPIVVAWLAQHVLGGPQAIGTALALATALLGGAATLVLLAGRRTYAACLDAGIPAMR